MNKKILSFVLVVLLVFLASPAFCAGNQEVKTDSSTTTTTTTTSTPITTTTTSKPVEVTTISTTSSTSPKVLATVKLVTSSDITQEDYDNLVAEYTEAGYDMSTVSSDDILNYLVQQTLLMQAYIKAGFVDNEMNMTEDTLNNVLNYYVYLLSQQGFEFADIDEFNNFLAQNEININEAIMYYAPDYLSQRYLNENYSDIINDVAEITENDVTEFFNNNKSQFTNSEKVKVAHVMFSAQDENAKKTAKILADSVYSQIKSGKLTFEKAVTSYSNDTDTTANGGILGWINQTETEFEQMNGVTPQNFSEYHKLVFGENTYNSLFNYDDGEITPVLESPYGYHIFKIINHQGIKTLGIDDKIYPETDATVHDFIVQYLYYLASQMAIQNAENQMFADLVSEAEIVLY